MIKKNIKKATSLLLVLLLVISSAFFTSCDKGRVVNELSFSEANSITDMEKLDGEKVSIIGYMSTLSPVNGEFMYLMNLPYQSCPFCVPNTSQLSNTLAVYAKDGKAFEFTDLLIKVEGELEFGDYTDDYGYQYSYRIKDATYTKVDTSELGEKYLLWQQLAQTGAVADVYAMHEYLYFLCFWGQYTAQFDEIGADYLYPENALMFIKTEGAQYNYGYVEGYYDDIVRRIEEVDKEAFAELVENIRMTEALALEALSDLEAGNYTYQNEYTGSFGDGRIQYKMNRYDEFVTRTQAIFTEFSSWIAEWEI